MDGSPTFFHSFQNGIEFFSTKKKSHDNDLEMILEVNVYCISGKRIWRVVYDDQVRVKSQVFVDWFIITCFSLHSYLHILAFSTKFA